MIANPYKELDVAVDSTPADIKAAYRERVSAAHPDTGGSDAAFSALSNAYTLLIDPHKRRRFDAGEDPEGPASKTERAINNLCGYFDEVLSEVTDIETVDLMQGIKDKIEVQRQKSRKLLSDNYAALDRNQNIQKLLKGDGPLRNHLLTIEKGINEGFDKIEFDMDVLDIMYNMLEDYEYNFTVPAESQWGDESYTFTYNPGQ